MKRLTIQALLLLLLAPYALATPMEEGVAAYQEADYAKAIELFSQALAEEAPTAEAYYNLASAYYKNGEIAPAILNFNRAYRIDPTDSSTRFNLTLLNSQITDKIEEAPSLFISRWLRPISHWLQLKTWRSLGTASILTLASGLFYYFRGRSINIRRQGFYCAIASLLLGLLYTLMAYQSYSFTHEATEAILMSSIVTIKSSPDASAKDIAVVHAGLKVKTLQSLAGFTEIQLPDGTVGWVPQDAYQLINNFD